jgi:hypothetical protein
MRKRHIGRKHIHLRAEGYLSNRHLGKTPLAWDDVYLSYKDGTYKNGHPKGKTIHLAPCLISRAGLQTDLAEARELAKHYPQEQRYQDTISELEAVAKRLDAGEFLVVVEYAQEKDIPAIYLGGELVRKTAEQALGRYLATKGIHHPKYIWAQTDLLVWPC